MTKESFGYVTIVMKLFLMDLIPNVFIQGHFKEGYGKLIYLYCRLLVVKLDFHRRNQKFPGNLIIKDVQLESVCEHDINL